MTTLNTYLKWHISISYFPPHVVFTVILGKSPKHPREHQQFLFIDNENIILMVSINQIKVPYLPWDSTTILKRPYCDVYHKRWPITFSMRVSIYGLKVKKITLNGLISFPKLSFKFNWGKSQRENRWYFVLQEWGRSDQVSFVGVHIVIRSINFPL